MQLREAQESLGQLLLSREGLHAVKTPTRWHDFCETLPGRGMGTLSRERLHLYEELLFASVETTLSTLYPFCRRLFSQSDWHDWVERFRREFPNPSFQLYRAASAFPAFLTSQDALLQQFPFLSHLAYYEWLEVELLNAKDSPLPDEISEQLPNTMENLKTHAPSWNPDLELLNASYDIPQILQQFKTLEPDQPVHPEVFQLQPTPTALLLYRDPEHLNVRFFHLNPLTAHLFSIACSGGSYLEIFEKLQNDLKLPETSLESLISEGMLWFHQCQDAHILQGSVPVKGCDDEPAL